MIDHPCIHDYHIPPLISYTVSWSLEHVLDIYQLRTLGILCYTVYEGLVGMEPHCSKDRRYDTSWNGLGLDMSPGEYDN